MGRGGARAGAGRKGLTDYEKLLIGAECERRWDELGEREAIERYEALPETKAIRLEQSSTELIPTHLRRSSRQRLKDISEDIDDITEGARRVTIPIKRPYGAKPQIIADVIAYVAETYGIRISAGQVSESWKEWSKFKKSPEYRASLKSP
ncbi:MULTISPECIES: hypothetical protein [unclassified Bradyrhizobium]|uniref:hypothetical protein n=1 Tax=unclassified Bradyrhizobium TaxID=2631580 RepID=UPI001FFB7001|nr:MULTISPECIES: hypothetical protein [unclassified Bradyrhizobium]MCK1304713.1 hypothetical protein [Bradyrhizobium sp. 45]MCK1608568.1 hypothetical protein [Bradyrhizobium sp. 163]MCK1766340.1 hypothetical protein [Bradyrhizobium sp. 136]